MKFFLIIFLVSLGMITNGMEVIFNSTNASSFKLNKLSEPVFLEFGIDEVYYNDSKVIVMTEGMYRSLTNKLAMLTYWCQSSYKNDMTTLSGIEKWHGRMQRTIVTNNIVYLEFADGYLHQDISGRMTPKTRFENNRNRPKSKPMLKPRTRNELLNIPNKPMKSIVRSRKISESTRVPNDLNKIRSDRVNNVTNITEVTIKFSPGRKVTK